MKNFFAKNKTFLAIFIGALIIGAVIYFSPKNNPSPSSLTPPSSPTSSVQLIQCPAVSEVLVTKVIDGDTIVVEGGYHLRLLEIDADESGYPCYEAAKKRLEDLILNKKVRIEKDITEIDQYKRCLRYVFAGEQNIGLELVKEGLAIARFYEPDVKYKKEISLAEETAIENKIGCKWSDF